MTDINDMSNEDPCLHFEAKLVPDLRTKIKKRLIAAICDLKQPCGSQSITTDLDGENLNVNSRDEDSEGTRIGKEKKPLTCLVCYLIRLVELCDH